MRKRFFLLMLAFLLCLLSVPALAQEGLTLISIPDVLRPGKAYSIIFDSPYGGTVSLVLEDLQGNPLYTVYEGYPVSEGENILGWDGVTAEQTPVASGNFQLVLTLDDGSSIVNPVRIGAPVPMLTEVLQSEYTLEEIPLEVNYTASEKGILNVSLTWPDGTVKPLAEYAASGSSTFQWNGLYQGERVPAGEYALGLTLIAENGQESMAHYIWIEVINQQQAESHPIVDITPAPTPVPTPTPLPISAPYSTEAESLNFWSMHPGEVDDAIIWEVLTQPITVYDGVESREHTYLRENPDGTGKKIAQIHGESQGLHVIGEVNEHGYVLVEAFSNYDPDYLPDDLDTAFDLKRGYIKASGLKTVEVSQEYGLVVDILSQRLYIFHNGERITELLISTGKIEPGKPYNETIPGEYMTISRSGGFWSGNMYCDMGIRINGGILVHEVPCKINADGTRRYSSFEGYLGTMQSHGCIRVQRLKNDDGYNHAWLWNNLPLKTKVLVWGRLDRVDTPEVWYPNPEN